MAKTQTPFLSLNSQGTVGGFLTTQKSGRTTILRSKPVPTDPYSLPQAYQRWLYEDYAYLWTQQSAATRAIYRSAGSRYHLTGFQYWMKYHLTNLPDIAGYFKLDEKTSATAYDSSRHLNHATIFGASPSIGRIDGALYFDGINDYLRIPKQDQFDFRNSTLTLDFFLRINTPGVRMVIINHRGALPHEWSLTLAPAGDLYLYVEDGFAINSAIGHITIGQLHHIICHYQDQSLNGHIFIDGTDRTTIVTNRIFPFETGDIYVGTRAGDLTLDLDGYIDNLIIYDRELDQTEITRHAARRYPV